MVRNPPASAGDSRDRFDPWVRKIPWSEKWQPAPISLPGESCGQRTCRLQSVGLQRVGHTWSNLS